MLGLIRIDVSSTVAYATRGEGIGSVPWLLGVAEPCVAAGGGQRCVECGSGPPSSAEGAALLEAPRCPSHGNRPRPPVGKCRRGGCCCSAVHYSLLGTLVGAVGGADLCPCAETPKSPKLAKNPKTKLLGGIGATALGRARSCGEPKVAPQQPLALMDRLAAEASSRPKRT